MKTKFNLSHYKNFTCDQGQLIPTHVQEVLPGDLQQHSVESLIRVAPLLTPVMHPVKAKTYSFYVPSRIIWEDWEDFITGGDDGNDASVFPQITLTATEKSLADYMGIPLGTSYAVNALPFRAYALIWNEYFRDQDLQTELTIDLTSGADTTTNTTLQYKCWEKDFFTTCRATEQKGDDVTLPLGTSAPIRAYATSGNLHIKDNDGNNRLMTVNPAGNPFQFTTTGTGTGMVADLTSATSATINQLRTAFAEQRFKEARSRYGNDYREYLKWLLGPGFQIDSRLQKPEYLGGGSASLSFSEIIQNGPDYDSNDGVGTIRGHGISALRSNRYKKFFPEHGYVITLQCVLPKTMYSQGLNHMWSKTSKEQFFQKEYEHTGQRAVLNKEVYLAHTTPEGTFGYQDLYDEYRQIGNSVAGEFHSTLNQWHMARNFASDPSLNATFVKSNPTDRIYASTTTNELQIMAYHSIQSRRLLSKRSR